MTPSCSQSRTETVVPVCSTSPMSVLTSVQEVALAGTARVKPARTPSPFF